VVVRAGIWCGLRRGPPAATAREPFGNDAMRARLAERLKLRHTLQRRHSVAIGGAIAAFAGAALLLWLSRRQQGRERPALDLSQLGTPRVSTRQMFELQLRLNGPMLALLVPMLLLQFTPLHELLRPLMKGRVMLVLLALALVVSVVMLPLWLRRFKRLAGLPEFEPLLNALALRKLQSGDTLPQLLRDGERVLETFMLQRATMRWAVLTDERLLLFKATLFDQRPEADVPLEQIVAVSAEPGTLSRRRKPKLIQRALAASSWIEIGLRDDKVISGGVASASLAQRLVERLGAHAARAATPGQPLRSRPSAPALGAPAVPFVAVLASALVPGSGQWMQGRGRHALLLFVPWLALLLFVTTPLVWALAGPRTDVPPALVLSVAAVHVLCAVGAAWDAWRMRGPGPRAAA
jgi:hypothetical protein